MQLRLVHECRTEFSCHRTSTEALRPCIHTPEVDDEVNAAGATRCPVKPRAAGVATHAEHPAHPARTAAAVAAFLEGAIVDEWSRKQK